MELFDNIIKSIEELLKGKESKHFDYDESKCWKETDEFELIMARDAAFELGGSSLQNANCTCITSSNQYVDKDEVILIGKDLCELNGDASYGRIAILQVSEGIENKDKEKLFRAIQKIDFVKYHVFPKGFMARTSALSNNEQVRVSKDAIKEGISFSAIGNTFIRRYKEVDNVLKVKVIFIADADVDFKALRDCAKTVVNTTKALSKIMEGMPTDCHACSLKPVCDEVEGMRELHFGKDKKE